MWYKMCSSKFIIFLNIPCCYFCRDAMAFEYYLLRFLCGMTRGFVLNHLQDLYETMPEFAHKVYMILPIENTGGEGIHSLTKHGEEYYISARGY